MRCNSSDMTLEKNYLQKYRFLIREYEQVKAKMHPTYRRVMDFYEAHSIDRRTFIKYYNRYLQSGDDRDLLPQKRGPRYKTRRTSRGIEQQVLALRREGHNRYEIHNLLKPSLQQATPAPSTIYQISRRHGLGRLKPVMKEEKRRIIKEKAGELAHADTHHLSKDILLSERKSRYVVGVVDDCTRIAWAEVVDDSTALTVMFAMLRCLNMIAEQYQIRFAEMMTDNGPEFGSRNYKNRSKHAFERLLSEMGIRHRYTRPYRPQTNGKIERLWRTMNEELLEGTTFETLDELKNNLLEWLVYYNHHRPHQALGGKPPAEFNHSCPRIT